MLKYFLCIHCALTIFLMVLIFVPLGFSQVNLDQEAYAIFEQNCLNCHGEHGAFTEAIVIDHTALIETRSVVPRNPDASSVYAPLSTTMSFGTWSLRCESPKCGDSP